MTKDEPKKYTESRRYTRRQIKGKMQEFQVKGDPKEGRKTSKPKVTEEDQLSSAHNNEEFRKKAKGTQNRGGRS